MKRIISALIAVLMMLCIGMPAFADEEAWEGEPAISPDTTEQTLEEITDTAEVTAENVTVVDEAPESIGTAVREAEVPELADEQVECNDAEENETSECLTASDPAEEAPFNDALPEEAPEDEAEAKEAKSYSVASQIIISGMPDLDNDDLFARYVEIQLYGPGDVMWSDGWELTGINAVLYDALLADVIDVAAGICSSTEFVYTAEDLGLPEEISNEELNSINLDAIMSKLAADHPYELYWYDKTVGCNFKSLFSSYQGADSVFDYKINITLYVSRDYALGSSITDVDTSNAASVQAAVDRAQGIVAKYAGYSDFDKLVAYRDEICSLVSYNDEAAGNESTPFGNPWQLIWVFDGDDSTTVVCEGYAKAFKYLCDLTEFDNDIQCITVTGDMYTYNNADGGGHMWNVVAMDDGENYIVDVTNCDEGTIGAPDHIFLTGCDGSVSQGYECKWGTGNAMWVRYTYDEDTLAYYDGAQLTLSSEDYEYVPQEDPDPPQPLLGDVNGDDQVNAADLLRMLRYLNGEKVDFDESVGDVNEDGRIDLGDLIRLLKILISSASSGSSTPAPISSKPGNSPSETKTPPTG